MPSAGIKLPLPLREDRGEDRASHDRISHSADVRSGPRVGLLAVQGDYAMHRQQVERLGYDAQDVRTVGELSKVDCLIMPGGESTTMRKLLKIEGLWDALKEFGKTRPIMGTCAGLILLGRRIAGASDGEDTLGLIDIDSGRNAYGSQYHSFRQTGDVVVDDISRPFEMIFIRAPKITRIGAGVEVLGRLNGEPTIVRQGHTFALTFHPELSFDGRIHEFFLREAARVSGL